MPGNGGGGCDTELAGSVDMAFPGCVSFGEVWWLANVKEPGWDRRSGDIVPGIVIK